MPRHPLALFSLKAHNPQARAVIAHPSNNYLQSTLKDGTPVLDVGFNIRSRSRKTLATLGRNGTDIIVEGPTIGRVQCSFEIDLDPRVVMLYDRSNGQTTQVSGDNSTPFEHGRLRRVVVRRKLNTIIGMGGVGCNFIQFELIWHDNPCDMVQMVKEQEAMSYGVKENPFLARTVDEVPTVLPPRRVARIHTPGERKLRMRYEKVGRPLGSGQFGIVHKCIDVDLGKFMAVKVLKCSTTASEQEKWSIYNGFKREVETLSKISHPHIVDYITSQGWDEPRVEIFMGLKDGNLASLIGSMNGHPIATPIFKQMLQALDCLAWNGIVHRDVKPENILYTLQPDGQYHFQLGDFGLCNRAVDATTFAGTFIYMPPEMFLEGSQTHKVDVWSLFVTMLWVLDVGKFRQMRFKCNQDVHKVVSFAASNAAEVSSVGEMAIRDPEQRASAAQMLVKHFNGEGLTTPPNRVPAPTSTPPKQVPALTSTPPTIATTRVRSPARLFSRNLRSQTRARGLQAHGNMFVVADHYRVEKRPGRPPSRPFLRLPEILPKLQAIGNSLCVAN